MSCFVFFSLSEVSADTDNAYWVVQRGENSFMFLFMILCLNERSYFIGDVRKCGLFLGVFVPYHVYDTDNPTTMFVCMMLATSRTSIPKFVVCKVTLEWKVRVSVTV